MKTCADFARLLEAFFTDRLMNQRQASPHTVASYRDTFRLLLQFAQQRLHKAPSALALEDFKAPFIGTFLDHLEKDRGNSARTRNVRLAAIHSFFRYVALEEPTLSAMIQRVLTMPTKRYERRTPTDSATRATDATVQFPSACHAQRFLSVQGVIHNLFHVGRHLLQARHHRELRAHASMVWHEVTCA
jgi:integrase/recombinase XerD